jgi:YfiH family protein
MLLEKNGIPCLTSREFARAGPLVHGFLGRKGVSLPPLASCRDRRIGDTQKGLAQNYERLARAFGLPSRGPVTINQVHGNSVFIVEDRGAGGPHEVEADAIVTNVEGIALGVLTADCLPILLFDPVKKVAGAVHAGWKGTVKKVTTAAVEAFTKNFGSNPGDLTSALGPCIEPCCYTVDNEVQAQYKRAFGDLPGYIRKGPGSRFNTLDIRTANIDQLLNAGLRKENISTESVCTSCRNELFFSYRKEGPLTGRQLSFVMIKE